MKLFDLYGVRDRIGQRVARNRFLLTLTMRDSFADLDKGPVLVQALGQEGAQKLIQRMPVGTVVHLERSLARFVPELSIMPPAP